MAAPFLATYQDLIDALGVATGGGSTTPEQRDVRFACQEAYTHLGDIHNWLFYRRAYRVQLSAPYDTGTIVYDHTGGASERLVTLTGGTFPSWARNGKIIIDNVVYEVAERLSDTTLTLDAVLNPGADVSSTSYTMMRSAYAMPFDFKGMFDPQDENQIRACYVRPHEWHSLERTMPTQTDAFFWTVMPSPDTYAGYVLRTWGYPSTAQSLDFMYQGRPRPIKRSGYETSSRAGTVTLAANTAVQGNSTTFTSDMVGSILRVTSSTTVYPTGEGDLNVWSEQKVITAYTAASGASALTVDSSWGTTYTTVLYTISDPCDVDHSLWNFLLATAKHRLWKIRGNDRVREAEAQYLYERRLAKENNTKLMEDQRATGIIWSTWTGDAGWLPGANIETP